MHCWLVLEIKNDYFMQVWVKCLLSHPGRGLFGVMTFYLPGPDPPKDMARPRSCRTCCARRATTSHRKVGGTAGLNEAFSVYKVIKSHKILEKQGRKGL